MRREWFLAVGAETSDFETCLPKFTVLNERPFQPRITFKPTKFNPLCKRAQQDLSAEDPQQQILYVQ